MACSIVQRRPRLPVGIIFSTSSSYAAIGRDMGDGALLAMGQVNADPPYPFTLEPVTVNPDGALDAYRSGCETLRCDRDIRHVIGWVRRDAS